MLKATKRASIPVYRVCFVRAGLCEREKVPRLLIRVSREGSRVVLVIPTGSVGHFLLAWPLRLSFPMPLFLHGALAGGVQRAGLPLLFPALTLH